MQLSAKQIQQKDILEHFILQSFHIAMVGWIVKSAWIALISKITRSLLLV